MSAEESLLSLLQRRIRKRGRITFRAFMETALYEPGLGRYCSATPPMGPEGDYITSPEVDEAFGRLVGRALSHLDGRLGSPDPFVVMEMGPGKGTLCRDLLAGLASEAPDLRRRVRYVLAEPSAAMRDLQRATLAGADLLENVAWIPWEETVRRAPFTGCLLANEFLDALPVHLVEWQGGSLKEIYVTLAPDGRLAEEAGEPSDPRLEEYFAPLGAVLAEGQRAEVNLAALDWISQAARALDRGFALVIDYGHEAGELFSARHYAGTLLGYRRHTLVVDPLAAPGEHDLTSHVDFTSLRREALKAGFETWAMTSQRNFLVALGLAEEIAKLAGPEEGLAEAEKATRRFALHSLMSPAGMGETFKVLLYGRGAGIEGLRFLDNPFRGPVEAPRDGV